MENTRPNRRHPQSGALTAALLASALGEGGGLEGLEAILGGLGNMSQRPTSRLTRTYRNAHKRAQKCMLDLLDMIDENDLYLSVLSSEVLESCNKCNCGDPDCDDAGIDGVVKEFVATLQKVKPIIWPVLEKMVHIRLNRYVKRRERNATESARELEDESVMRHIAGDTSDADTEEYLRLSDLVAKADLAHIKKEFDEYKRHVDPEGRGYEPTDPPRTELNERCDALFERREQNQREQMAMQELARMGAGE